MLCTNEHSYNFKYMRKYHTYFLFTVFTKCFLVSEKWKISKLYLITNIWARSVVGSFLLTYIYFFEILKINSFLSKEGEKKYWSKLFSENCLFYVAYFRRQKKYYYILFHLSVQYRTDIHTNNITVVEYHFLFLLSKK